MPNYPCLSPTLPPRGRSKPRSFCAPESREAARSERVLTLPILPKGGLIGVKKNFDSLGEGAIATFDVIAVGADGHRAMRKGVTWSLYKVNNDYQWYNQDGRWGFERIKSSKRVGQGKIDLATDAATKISSPVGLGQYRLDVASDTARMRRRA